MKSLQQKVLELTGFFETGLKPPGCYGVSVGNFDGAGMSYGVLQFNFRSGTLQPILKSLFNAYQHEMENIFGTSKLKVLDMVLFEEPVSEQIKWADSITQDRSLKAAWKVCFRELGKLEACQQLQLRAVKSYLNRAVTNMKVFNVKSERAFALLFDVAVQCGSFGSIAYKNIMDKFSKDTDMSEQEKLLTIAREKAYTVSPRWRHDVMTRKEAIATGAGIVHGKPVNLERDFGITAKVVDESTLIVVDKRSG